MPQQITQIQQLQFDLMEKSSFNEFDGPRIVSDLVTHSELWLGAVMGDICRGDLIVLRDIKDNYWNVATLYILCYKEQAKDLRKLATMWKADEMLWLRDPQAKLADWSSESKDYKILSLWWD